MTADAPDEAVPTTPPAEDVEALRRVIRDAYIYAVPVHSIAGVPEVLLASDWLARDRAAQRERLVRGINAAMPGSAFDARYRDGYAAAIFEVERIAREVPRG